MQFVRGVLHHDHGRVHQDADADGDAAQRHDVAGDVQIVHEQEADQRRHRQGQTHHERRAEVGEDQQDGDGRDDDLFAQRPRHRVDGRLDQSRAVVERNDAHALR